jgi:hypothetical protein
MSWVRLDDRLHDNRKIKRLWLRDRGALALHLMALSYCGGHETDGLVDTEFLTLLAPGKADRDKLTASLVDAGVWVAVADGWQINDFLEYNPSSADLNEKRRKDSERKARGRRTQSERSPDGIRAESAESPEGVRAASGRPVPARPDPTLLKKAKGSTNVSKALGVERFGLGAAA